MAESLLSFGVEKLWNLFVRESERFQGVGEQFNELKSDLNMLRCFLEDADAKKHTSAMVRNTVKEIKEIVYDAEDVIETFVLKEELGRTSGIKNCIGRLAVIVDRREIALDIKVLHNKIANVIRNMQTLGVIANDGYMPSLQERQRQMRQTFFDNKESFFVGLEENVKKLVGHLVKEDGSQVVSITGMGGIGKTTLARQVFNHETVKSHFTGLAWVCVSQEFTRKDIWQTILQKVGPEYWKSEMTENELHEILLRVLETRKAFIVLDDIWREGDWELIKPIFSAGKGWKVLFTSRNEGVALKADPNCFTCKPDCLTFDESWTIFRRIVFPRENTAEMEELGKKMLKHCGGLPLAVKVLGGLLVEQYTLDEWKRIYEDIRSNIINFNDNSVYYILSLSFEELPIYLKLCFLCFAQFPEDYAIEVEKLSHFWAAEGIPRPSNYDRYIQELVKRNMVISERDIATSRFKTCHLHDMMREVCLRKAEEENFVHIVNTTNSHSPCNSRRIAIHELDETSHRKWEMENPKLRSILFIHDYTRKEWMESGICFKRLQLMRVLDLSLVSFKEGKLPSDIGKLIHLRYLNLNMADVTHLPSSMRNLKLLLYLNLKVQWSQIYVPNFFKEMRELRELLLPWRINDKAKLELGNLVNLEKLENFSTPNSSVKDLQGMTKLRILSINIRGKVCNMETLSVSLSKLIHLEDLTIDDYTKDEKEFVLNLRGYIQLKKLWLEIYMLSLPDEQHFSSHLTTISLKGCGLKEDPMPILEKLLQLKEVCLYGQSFSGRRMVCSGGGFPQLHTLLLSGIEEWEEWIVEEGSMPILNTLEIWCCPMLKQFPNGGFPQLRELKLKKLEEWEEWIVEEGSIPLLHTLQISNCPKLKKFANGGFPQLQELELNGLDEWEEWIVEEGSMPLLHTLYIWLCPKFKKFPNGGFPQLQKFKLGGLEEWEEWIEEEGSMPLLHTLTIWECRNLKNFPNCRFPQLQELRIKGLKEWEEWIVEEGSMPLLHTLYIWDCPKLKKFPNGGFPQLHKLELYKLEEWEEWIVEEGSMPLLHTLGIRNCPKLKKFPSGLRFIYSLKKLKMDKEWKERLSEGGEDFYKVQHIPSVYFFDEWGRLKQLPEYSLKGFEYPESRGGEGFCSRTDHTKELDSHIHGIMMVC